MEPAAKSLEVSETSAPPELELNLNADLFVPESPNVSPIGVDLCGSEYRK